jgi:hypothetical protein
MTSPVTSSGVKRRNKVEGMGAEGSHSLDAEFMLQPVVEPMGLSSGRFPYRASIVIRFLFLLFIISWIDFVC